MLRGRLPWDHQSCLRKDHGAIVGPLGLERAEAPRRRDSFSQVPEAGPRRRSATAGRDLGAPG
jgi:hypothetical protein